jgi:hypothetical protein
MQIIIFVYLHVPGNTQSACVLTRVEHACVRELTGRGLSCK